ncbi:hypothetical protein HHK36_014486 [Tetracentron sinense]|uniref:Uncharacterized protein n=1 Tax=Tetracentron sinense TaxID=13715 RepID=A0A834ZEU5_TETSI|nr:hypothetical protein HHK36_014486 [Tetracentron sinense]
MAVLSSTASQYSLFLPPQSSPFPISTQGQAFFVSCRGPAASSYSLSPRRLKNISHGHRLSKGIVRAVAKSKAAPLVVESAGEETELRPDSNDGDGFDGGEGGDSGGGGGGGGGRDDEDNINSNGDRNEKKMAMSMSQKLTLGYAALIGDLICNWYVVLTDILTVGGVMGFVKSGSQKSLAAGGLSALLLYYVYTELPARPAFASSIGLGLSAALLGVMGSRFKKSGKIFPAGVISFVSLVMSGGYLHGILRGLH